MNEPTNRESLPDALQREMARVRDEVMPPYKDIGAPGVPALMMMRMALDGATKALAEGDTIMAIHWFKELKGFSL